MPSEDVERAEDYVHLCPMAGGRPCPLPYSSKFPYLACNDLFFLLECLLDCNTQLLSLFQSLIDVFAG